MFKSTEKEKSSISGFDVKEVLKEDVIMLKLYTEDQKRETLILLISKEIKNASPQGSNR